MATLTRLGIEPIDLIIINLYPFKQTVMKPGATAEECIENIDIGGPSMLRAAAKNHHDVTVLVDPADYAKVLAEIAATGNTTLDTRFGLARKVFEHTAAYDALIAQYFQSQTSQSSSDGQEIPAKWLEQLTLTYERVSSLRYGENPHQSASFYREALPKSGSLTEAEQLGGKELSYNNLADTDAAIALLKEFSEPTVVAVKHANPCGVGSADTLLSAWAKAYEADTVSIFGGIVALNRPVTAEVADQMKEIFLEVIIAPDYDAAALEILQKKKNLRLLKLPAVAEPISAGEQMIKAVYGGILVQDQDTQVYPPRGIPL